MFFKILIIFRQQQIFLHYVVKAVGWNIKGRGVKTMNQKGTMVEQKIKKQMRCETIKITKIKWKK